jgi:NAD(P)H dehydrogenase (quinone)
MNKLIVTANPREKWFTHKIAMRYKEVSEQKWDTVEILDLYKTDLKQWFLTYENRSDVRNDSTTQAIQSKITWADEITLVFPIWWADAPAIMKNFIDCNFTSWFAFKFINWKPTWLLTWKTAKIFATCWAPSFIYRFFPLNLKMLWWTLRLGYCGMKFEKIEIFWWIETKTEEQKIKLLEKVK